MKSQDGFIEMLSSHQKIEYHFKKNKTGICLKEYHLC